MKKALMLLTVGLAFVLSCGNVNVNQKGHISRDDDNMQRFKKFSYNDTRGTGTEAYSFLMPTDWQFEGGMTWNPEQVAIPGKNKRQPACSEISLIVFLD